MARRPRYKRVAIQEGRRAGVRDPLAFMRQMDQEAHGQDLRSPAGAQGPAQFMPATAASVGLSPAQMHKLRPSYRAAAKLMAGYERQYGSTRSALIAYNAGPGRVGSSTLPAETRAYIARILPNGERRQPSGSTAAGTVRPYVPRRPGATSGPRTRTVTKTENLRMATFDRAGYEEATRRQQIASFLERGGRGHSVLFRSGLLSSAAVDPSLFHGTTTRKLTTTSQVPLPGAAEALPPRLRRDFGGQGGPSDDAVKTAVRAARNRLGISEVGTTNRSPKVDAMSRKFGMVGVPWCGIYVGTVLRRVGVKVDSRVASVAEIETMARNRTGGFEGGWHSTKHARRGDALVTRQGQHVAFVENVDRDGTIHVIGGNQSGAVTRATWRPDQVYGVARPGYKR